MINRTAVREEAKSLVVRGDLLDLLNEIKFSIEPNAIPFTMSQMMTKSVPSKRFGRYQRLLIPKKTGGFREVNAPVWSLKWLQLCLNEMFKSLYTPSEYAMGFVEGRSVVDNASCHLQQNYVFNIDLKDFFTSIDQARVWKRLQLSPFNFNPRIAGIIAGMCSIQEVSLFDSDSEPRCYLPQGAPTSPILSNAVCDTLDRRLAGLARRFGLHYTRYADDITFSSMHNVYQPNSVFREELDRIISSQGFKINEGKTRLHHRSRRQEVTGLTVGRKVNVSRRYLKDLRAVLHIWEKYGEKAACVSYYPNYLRQRGRTVGGRYDIKAIVEGKICYLKMVKGESDPVYRRLKLQYDRIRKEAAPQQVNSEIEYVETVGLAAFQRKVGSDIEFVKDIKGRCSYCLIEMGCVKIPIFLSRHVDVENLSAHTKISLCRQGARWFFMVHRPCYRMPETEMNEQNVDIADIPEGCGNNTLEKLREFFAGLE